MRVRPLLAVASLAAFSLAGCRTAAPPPPPDAVVYVVRHAERQDDSNDTALSAAGEARALALADSLARWGLPDAVYSTRYVRTQGTAAPTAARAGKAVEPYGGSRDAAADARALVDRVRTLAPGRRALLVGHSNTVPSLLNAFDGGTRPDLNAADYDGVYLVTLHPPGSAVRATVRRVRFGADDGTPDPR